MSDYEVTLEVAGPLAMFARPDTGGTPTSYPVPTWSAAKGIFESIAFLSDGAAWIDPTKVEVCRCVLDSAEDPEVARVERETTSGPGRQRPPATVRYQRYTTNYGGPLRKTDLLRKGPATGGSSMQFFATVLSDVCYRLYGAIRGPQLSGRPNARHYLKELFERRIRQGRCFRTPCLGWSEFTCSYWGPFRNGVTEVDETITLEVPSMLLCVWERPTLAGRYAPIFRQYVSIQKGVLWYDAPIEREDGARQAGAAEC